MVRVNAEALQGTWHIIATTFPMWTKGDRREPTLTYTRLRTEGGRARFDDTVSFVRGGRRRTIEGVDTQDPEDPSRFRWRGRGILFVFTSNWSVVLFDPEGRWAAIRFDATLATPAGLDIVARAATLDGGALDAIKESLRADPAASPLVPGLVTLPIAQLHAP